MCRPPRFSGACGKSCGGFRTGQRELTREIAHALGKPTAIRAVARACATNPVSVVVPCHRVVRQDGSLAGYRWGIERKRSLLEHESAVLGGETKQEHAKAK